MTVRLYLSFAADLAAVVLMLVQLFSIHKLSGEKSSIKRYFRAFSGMVLVMSALHLLKSFANLQMGDLDPADYLSLPQSEVTVWIWMAAAAWILDIFLSTVFLYMWITFLSWYLYEDRDFIRRRFWAGFTPLIISAAVTCVSIPLAILTEKGYIFFMVAVGIFFVIRVFYFLAALWLLRDYKKQNGYLRFFNPWVFFVPVFAGWLAQDIFDLGFAALGSTLGVMLLYSSIVGVQRYMDPETGLYNMEFPVYLKELIRKKKYDPCSAMTFTVGKTGDMKEFAEILKKQLTQDCEPIRQSDRKVVVLTNVKEKAPLAMVIGDVQAVLEEQGSEMVKAGCSLKKKTETAESFMERVL